MAHNPGSTRVVMEFASTSQAEGFWQWFRDQGGLETFLEADISAEHPDSCTLARKPLRESQDHYRFVFA